MAIVDYLCLTCALKSEATDVTFPVDTDKSALQCPKCGSSAVISKDKFLAAAQSSLNAPVLAEKTPRLRTHIDTILDDQTRWDAPRLTDKNEGINIRNFLKRNKLNYIEDWWDGFRSYVSWSFTDDIPAVEVPLVAESEWLTLKLTNRSGDSRLLTFYFNPEDEGMIDIGDVRKKGT